MECGCARAEASARVERCFPYTVCLSVSTIQGMPLLNVPAAWCTADQRPGVGV